MKTKHFLTPFSEVVFRTQYVFKHAIYAHSALGAHVGLTAHPWTYSASLDLQRILGLTKEGKEILLTRTADWGRMLDLQRIFGLTAHLWTFAPENTFYAVPSR